MGDASQKRALAQYRSRLAARGLHRFEVVGLDTDRDLIRTLARRLAEGGSDAARIRTEMERTVFGASRPSGGILAALRRSPLVGAELDTIRLREAGRAVDV